MKRINLHRIMRIDLQTMVLAMVFVFAFASVPRGQEIEWIRQFGSVDPAHDVTAYAIDADTDGNVYVAGWIEGTLPGQTSIGNSDAFVRKYDVYGNELWTRQFGTSRGDTARGISTDMTGIYVAGYTGGTLPGQTSAGEYDAFVRKYDFGGTEIWTRQFGSPNGEITWDICADGTGVYVVGRTRGILPGQTSAGVDDAFVRKYDLNGTEIWTTQFGTSDNETAHSVSADGSSVYVSGETCGTFPGQTSGDDEDVFVSMFDATNGAEIWTRQFAGSGNSRDVSWGISVDISGIYVAGYVSGALPGQISAGGYDAFVRKYDFDGDEIWTSQFGTSSKDVATGISADSSGIYIAGITAGTLPGQTSAGEDDVFVRKYDFDGTGIWTRQFGSLHGETTWDICADGTDVYVVGRTHGTLPGQVSAGSYDAFVAKILSLPDNTGPIITNVQPSLNPVTINTNITLTANVDDSTTGRSYIASAEYKIGDGDFASMTAQDGNFDELSEDVTATIPAFMQPGVYTICVRGADASGNVSAEECILLSVDNAGPIVSNVEAAPNPVAVNTSITLAASVDDSTTGNSQIVSAEYRVDDGSFMPMSAQDGNFDGAIEDVTATISAFTEAGVHMICVQGTDAAGNVSAEECILLAVYDADGGFVTGGGWIDSPAGAYTPDLSLTGKANFGFVSKYKKGADIPIGQTEFQFKVAGMNFHSEEYQWLVVAGPKAQYKGDGTINGSGNYGFMLRAIDENLTPSTDVDLFRMKIWDKDDGDLVVYDNQTGDADDADPTTEVKGGNIVIHKEEPTAAPASDEAIPSETLLAQNYPNPFNPDTWIPYRLKEDANVVISIYSATGQLVRRLDLGYKNAGSYTSREKAVYWDGRNESGEPVSSGIYFYTFEAGSFSQTRGMTIMR